MKEKSIPLSSLRENIMCKITSIDGGYQIKKRLNTMGINNGKIISIKTKQPFHGPITIIVRGTQMTIGRGMARNIQVEIIDKENCSNG
jgi:DtxR family Mn-dependent transcriptional regulator